MKTIAALVVCLGMVATAWASAAKSYEVNLSNPTQVSGTELKPGTYTVQVAGDRVMLHGNNQEAQCTVKVEEGNAKFSSTSVRYSMVDGKYHIDEIRISGTKTKLVFAN
jgi:hypothetical protein